METLHVAAGQPASYRGRDFVILHVLDLYAVLAREIATGATERILISDLQPRAGDAGPRKPDVSLVGISDEAWQEANRRFEIIRPLLSRTSRQRATVEEAAKRAGVHWTTIYDWINKYLPSERISDLIPAHSDGGRGRSRIPEEAEKIVAATIESDYLTAQKPSVEETLRIIRSRCEAAGIDPPSVSTVQRRIRRIAEEEKCARRRGRRAATEKYAPHGTPPTVEWPLAQTQIDHAKLDILVVDSEYRLDVGRPWLTLLIDVFSRAVLGFYVSLDHPGASGTGLCIANAVLPKEGFLRLLDLGDLAWPCWGMPSQIMADNAKEFRGNMLRRACNEHGIGLQFRMVRQPQYGAHIERLMGTVNKELHLLPGTTFSNTQERGEYPSEAKAVFTPKELEQWLARWFLSVYHRRVNRGTGRTPLSLWEEGIRGTAGRPGIGIPPRVTDETRLRIDFMPYVERTVQQYGVEIEGVRYYDDKFRPHIAREDPSARGRTLRHRFHFDPRDLSRIYWMDPLSGSYAAVPYRNIAHPPISVWELRAAKRALREAGRREVDEDELFEAHERLRRQAQESAQKTKSARRANERNLLHREAQKPVLPAPQERAPVSSEPTVEIPPYDEYDELEDDR